MGPEWVGGLGAAVIPLAIWIWRIKENHLRHVQKEIKESFDKVDTKISTLESKMREDIRLLFERIDNRQNEHIQNWHRGNKQ